MPKKRPFARIAITLPPETLRDADALAARLDRSRSWVVAEAIRQYAAAQRDIAPSPDASVGIGASRLEQLRRDAALTPEARVLQSEEVVAVGGLPGRGEPPHSFPSFDAFRVWRRQRGVP